MPFLAIQCIPHSLKARRPVLPGLLASLLLLLGSRWEVEAAETISGPLYNPANGHIYFLIEESTWSDAEVAAVHLGGHLATIRSPEENEWLHSRFGTFNGVSRHLWVGLHDTDGDGVYRWISGDPARFANWATGRTHSGDAGPFVFLTGDHGQWDFAAELSIPSAHGVVELDFPVHFRRGDVNADSALSISDAVSVLEFLFLGSPQSITCDDAADFDDDGNIHVMDALASLGYQFLGGVEVPEPGRLACGSDPTLDDLSCATHSGCPDFCEASSCDPGDPLCRDCNGNGVADLCDILKRDSLDLNQNGIPDECHEEILQALLASSAEPAEAVLDAATGAVIKLQGRFAGVDPGASPEEKARDFLMMYGPLFSLPQDLEGFDLVPSGLSDPSPRVRFQQTFASIPVFACGVVVGINEAGEVMEVCSRVIPAQEVKDSIRIPLDQAADAARGALGMERDVDLAGSLVVLDLNSLFSDSARAQLAWRFSAWSTEGLQEVFVNVQDGSIALNYFTTTSEQESLEDCPSNPLPRYQTNPATGATRVMNLGQSVIWIPEASAKALEKIGLALSDRLPVVPGAGRAPDRLQGLPASPAVEVPSGALQSSKQVTGLRPGHPRTIKHDGVKLDLSGQEVDREIAIGVQPLSAKDLPPLDSGMTNVTLGPRKGYRLTPTPMRFKKKFSLRLPYDEKLIPEGMTEKDVRTYYYHKADGRWRPLQRVTVDRARGEIESLTDHFTDIVNATVTVPEHPDKASFSPTQIKDIKGADPGAQVNLIEPPRANSMGDARLSYQIEVPPGRQGIQAQLAVQYSSSGANGWMGMGWDLPMQAVTADTRWGVPRYDPALETETYLLNGEQLTPVAHRGDLQPRATETVFHTRVEGQFRRIVRHGDHPANYWWEVTDKNGGKSFFGGDPATNGPQPNSTLTDAAGNVFLWSLREVRDTNANFIRYHCVRISDPGVQGASQSGSNLYLQTITYTGHAGIEGPYVVRFFRDSDLVEPRRVDVQIDARGGFKRVTADLLRQVDISLGNELIRRYEFRYNENPYGDNRPNTAFNKTLLTSISQFAADGVTLFNTHTLTYYDEARDSAGNYHGFAGSSDWGIGSDGITAGLLGRGLASALGGSSSTSAGGHLYVGVGSCCDVTSKTSTAGLKVGFSRSQSETLITMADMDGDGLPDKVFKGGAGFSYRPNRSGPNGQHHFGEVVPLPTLSAISRDRVTSTTVGGESYFGLPVMTDVNRATTESDTYFSDVNGDGLTDLVRGGQVLFGFINAAGVPTFSANSADTPVSIGSGAIETTELLEDATAIEAERARNFPLLDTLRRWVAPYDGVVSITGPARLIQDTSDERAQYTAADGVRVAIQLEGAELWTAVIAADNYAPQTPTGLDAVPVQRGERLYFRVQSVFDGAFDQVAWDPEITYLAVDTTRNDVNDLPEYRYSASRDFTLVGRRGTVTLPVTGTLRLAGRWEKTGVTTDDVTLVISRNGSDVYRRTLGFAETTVVDLSQDLAVTALDVLEWRILVDSPIDATRIRLTPIAHYTAAEGLDSVTDEHGNFILQVSPTYDMDLYPDSTLTAPQDFYLVPSDGTVPAEVRIQIDGLSAGERAQAVFTVKRRGALLTKQVVDIVGTGAVIDHVFTTSVEAAKDDQLFFDLSSRDSSFASRVTSLQVMVHGTTVVPSALHTRSAEGLFSQPYRGWGAAGYNGNSPRDAQPINQSLLVLDSSYDPHDARAYLFIPRPAEALWGGVDELAWVKSGSASSSRLGLDDIRLARSEQFAGASAPSRISRSENVSGAAGITASTGSSRSQLEFQDLNGDRFPDVISSNGGVQYTRAIGGLEAGRRGTGLGAARKATNFTAGASTDGAGNIARAIAAARGHVAADGTKSGMTAQQGMDMPSLGFSANIGVGTSHTDHDLIDINGDGLLDRVSDNGTAELNLGYGFAPAEPWGGGIVNNGQSLDAGGGVNLGFNRDFYSMAGGLSLTIGMTKSDETYADLNGDGLPDKIVASSPFQVRLNTGAGFAPPVAWPGGHDKVAMDKHLSLNGGLYVTFGIAIPIAGIKIVFNPGGNFSTGMGRPEVAFRDVDGDGFADHVLSETDSELKVALNSIGRTNLLKRVHRPLGAIFEIEYSREGNTFELPQSRWVMSRTTVFDGVPGDHRGNGADYQVMTFAYQSPLYERNEREFYGYGTVTEIHLDTNGLTGADLELATPYRRITRHYLNTNYYNKGLMAGDLTEDVQTDVTRPFLETLNTFQLRDVETGLPVADPSSTTATVFPALLRTARRFYEGQPLPGKSTHTEHDYDALGNVTRFFDAGDTGAPDDLEAIITYTAADSACNNPTNYLVGLATRIEVRGNGALMRLRTARINCANGDVEEVSQFLEGGQAATTNLTYFTDGNLRTVTGPTNNVGQRYSVTYEYDPMLATHITGITDSFGYSSTMDHDLRFGKPTTTTDINGQSTTYVYDTVGRADTITGPYEQGTPQVTIDFDYATVQTPANDSGGNPIPLATLPFALTKHVDKDATGALKDPIETLLFIDGLKRVLQTKKDASIHGAQTRLPVSAMIVSGRLTIDHAGRTIEQFYPVTEPKGTNTLFTPTYDGIPPTVMEYDVLDRNTRTTIPDRTSTTIAYGFGADRVGAIQFETVVTDANNVEKRTYRDARELITSVKDFNQGGSQTIWTSYTYDPLKQVIAVRDDHGNVTAVSYDNMGRRTAIDNPDAGKTESVYDLASNVVQKITANLRAQGKAIEYDYDFNRLRAIRYPIFTQNNVTYEYGGPGAGANRADRIARVTDASGTTERSYGPLGELTTETKTIPVTGSTVPLVATTQYRYDTWNRLLQLTYPDGEVLTYSYDAGGLANRIQGRKASSTYPYVRRLEYDKFEQRLFQELGNGAKTTYSYRADNRRLATLQSTLKSGYRFQNLNYTYDAVGNITALRNDIRMTAGQSGLGNEVGGPSSQEYFYDDLYRLVRAEGHYRRTSDKDNRYTISNAYDTIHNFTLKDQLNEIAGQSTLDVQQATTYRYDYAYGAKPHAPAVIGPFDMTYDANGNLIRKYERATQHTFQNIWDEENRLACHHEDVTAPLPQDPTSCDEVGEDPKVRFTYDDKGTRIIKDSDTQRFYVNQYFTAKGSDRHKHIFVGTTRIVSKISKPDGGFEDIQYFTHSDHLGSSNVLTNLEGYLAEHVAYFPFGETWAQEHPVQPIAFQFTGKELDQETGLYYFGARYYDPRTSVWQSADPMLGDYFEDGAPGLGIRVPQNLALYSYSWNNPLIHRDKDGEVINLLAGAIGAAVGAVAGPVIYAGVSLYRGEEITGKGLLGAAAGGAVTGGVAGLSAGASLIIQAGAAGAGAVYGGVTNRAIVSDGNLSQTFDPQAMQNDFALGVVTFSVVKATGAAITTVRQPAVGRVAQDINVNPQAPRPLPHTRPIGASPTQNARLQADIAGLRARGATDIRVNQQQVNVQGQRVGVNRPDLQYTLNGKRYYVEYETSVSPRGPGHAQRIIANDPTAAHGGGVKVNIVD